MKMSARKTAAIVGAVAGLCIASGIIGASLVGRFDVEWGSKFSVDFGQAISIILAALGAILTAIALLIGVLAIIGWATFSSQVDQNVRRHIAEDFDDQGPLFQTVVADLLPKLEKSMFKGTEPPADELLLEEDPDK